MAGGRERPARRRVSGEASPAVRRSQSRRSLAAGALILAAGVCTYWNSFDVPFLWDDQTAIVTNQTIRDLWPPWRPLLPPLETSVTARPLVNASLAFNYAMHELDVEGYHAWNLGVHLMAALVFFGVVRRTLESRRMGGNAAIVALIAALWWVVHPLVSEIVDYPTQRTTAMMGLFMLASLYCAIRAAESPHASRRWDVLAIVACACGMASKEEMVVAPLVVALYDRVFLFRSVREALHARRRLYAGLASTWVGLGILMWSWPRSTVGFASGDAVTYALNQAQVIPHYLRLALWPDALVVDYGLPVDVPIGAAFPGALLIGALAAITLVAIVRWPAAGFLGAVFFLTLAPTSSVVPIVSEVGAERRMYLPLAAVAVLLVVAGGQLVRRAQSLWQARQEVVTAAALLLATAWIGSLAVRTVYRNAQYGDAVSLWRSSVDERPHGRARLAYANALVNTGQSNAAIAELRKAVHDYRPAHYALGVELAFEGDTAEAIEALETFIADDPAKADRLPARLLLAQLFFADGRHQESAQQFGAVAEVAPTNIAAQLGLGDIWLVQNRYAEAASRYRVVVGLQPDGAAWRMRLGTALAKNGQLAEAAEHFRTAIALDPENKFARGSLAMAESLLNNQ